MTGKNRRVQRRANNRDEQLCIYKHPDDPTHLPVLTWGKIDKDTASRAFKLSGHKGNVLLDEVQPGQRVFFNASFLLGTPFVYEPLVAQYQQYMRETSTETCRDVLLKVYMMKIKETVAMVPQVHAWIRNRDGQLGTFLNNCEKLAALKQLVFGEAVPLIDMASVKNNTHNMTEDSSSTKARKIIKPVMSGTSQGTTSGSGSKNVGGSTKGGKAAYTVPCMVMDGTEKTVYACFPDTLKDPERMHMPLPHMLKKQGVVVASEPFLLQAVDNFKKQANTQKPMLQQQYRDTFEACNQFVNREGTVRSEDEWLEFVTNCVHMHALRHVLHDKPLEASKPGQMPTSDKNMNHLLQKLGTMDISSSKFHDGPKHLPADADPRVGYRRAYGGQVGFNFDALDKVEEITIVVDDCEGDSTGILIRSATMKEMLDRAKELCQQDVAAAKLLYAELTKNCKTTHKEMSALRDKANIGIPEALKEIAAWSNDCIFRAMLRRVLHDVPMRAIPGRGGMPKGGGVLLESNNNVSMRLHDMFASG